MIKAYIAEHQERFLDELINFLKIPSISADQRYKEHLLKAAQFVADSLQEAGCDVVKLCDTPYGKPIVYGEKIIDTGLPTVMVYGHYDVQPPDPLELWDSPPFDPVVKKTEKHPKGAVYARGACDDKGQVYMHIKALEYMVSQNKLPCNVKFLIEGEEEVGSEGLSRFLESEREHLDCDVILISDTAMLSNDCPSITTSIRGISCVEVEVTGPNRDLHSGIYGGAVANPINILSKMIADLHDENNRIVIQGFYDDVFVASEQIRSNIAELPFSLERYKSHIGIKSVRGEYGYTTNERNSIRPTLDVNGIWGGYTGEGSKTVLPSKAYAKISMRLVPNQDCKKITELFQKHFESSVPEGVSVKVTCHHGGNPYILETDHPAYKAAEKAYKTTFGKRPFPQYTGGSIPIVSEFEDVLGVKSVLMGFGLDTDAIHSPNEHFGIFNFIKGIETIYYFFKNYAEFAKK